MHKSRWPNKFLSLLKMQPGSFKRPPGGSDGAARPPRSGVVASLTFGLESPHTPSSYLGPPTDLGRPSSNIRFSALHAFSASVAWASESRARSLSPTMDFNRKNVFSTRPW